MSPPSRASIASFSPRSGLVALTVAGQPADGLRRPVRRHPDRVDLLRPDDSERVDAEVGGVERDVDGRGRGAAEVAHGHVVGAAERREVDPLDAGHLGRAGEAVQDARAVEQAGHFEAVVARAADGGDEVAARAALDAVDPVRRTAREPVVAVAEVDDVVAAAAGHDVLIRPAEQRVGGVRAVDHILLGAAVEREADLRADGAVRVDEVDSAAAEDRQSVIAGARVPDPDQRVQALDPEGLEERAHGDVVEAVGAVDGDLVARAVEQAEVGVDVQHGRVRQVADVDQVLPAGGVDVECLDRRAVGRGGTGVAGDPRLAVEALQGELLAIGRPRGQQPVGAALAVDGVEPVALRRGVVACAEEDGVVARAGRHLVAVVAGRDQLRARAADHGVGAGAGLDRRRLRQGVLDVDGVVTRARADRDLVERRAVEVERRTAGVDLQRAGGDQPQRDAVGGTVAGDGQRVAGDHGQDRGLGGAGERDRGDRCEEGDSEHRGTVRSRRAADHQGIPYTCPSLRPASSTPCRS